MGLYFSQKYEGRFVARNLWHSIGRRVKGRFQQLNELNRFEGSFLQLLNFLSFLFFKRKLAFFSHSLLSLADCFLFFCVLWDENWLDGSWQWQWLQYKIQWRWYDDNDECMCRLTVPGDIIGYLEGREGSF